MTDNVEYGDAGFPLDPCWALVHVFAASGSVSRKKGTRRLALRVRVLESSIENVGETSPFMDNWLSPKLEGKMKGLAKACGQPYADKEWFEPNPRESFDATDPGDDAFKKWAAAFKGTQFLAKIEVERQEGYPDRNRLTAHHPADEKNLAKWRTKFVKTDSGEATAV